MLETTKLFFAGSLLAVSVAGCSGKSNPTSEGLDSESAALVDDSMEVDDSETTVESGLEESLSGATAEGAELDLTLDATTAAEAGRTNPGIFFKPAGCIVSTRAGNVITHTFTNCTGPNGYVGFNGVVTSTWSKITNGFEVVHATTGFKINGATINHTVTIDYTRVAGVYTRTRKGSTTGTTASGKPITHSADYVVTYDPAGSCITRNGASSTTIGDRAFSRSIKGWVRCGVGALGCPKSGTFTLTRGTRLNLVLEFPGGAVVDITINGKKYRRPLLCKA
jgi:hypothetical protein